MKKILALLVAIVSFSCSNAQKTAFSKEALAETLVALDGSEVTFQSILEKHKGKTIVLECWASWCGDCVKAMPKVKELQANNPDVVYVFLSCDKTADKWKEGIVLAYEPVWAIGTGETASPDQAQEMHEFIRETVRKAFGSDVAEDVSILYGGSVKPDNAKEIFSKPDVDGGLIGGAALKAEDFAAIVNAI